MQEHGSLDDVQTETVLCPEAKMNEVAALSLGTLDGEHCASLLFLCPVCGNQHQGAVDIDQFVDEDELEQSYAHAMMHVLQITTTMIRQVIWHEHGVDIDDDDCSGGDE